MTQPLQQFPLRLRLLRGRHLRRADWTTGESDPYAEVWLAEGGQKQRTRVATNTRNPLWNHDFSFTLTAGEADTLHVQVYDEDIGKRDELLGEVAIPVAKLTPLPLVSWGGGGARTGRAAAGPPLGGGGPHGAHWGRACGGAAAAAAARCVRAGTAAVPNAGRLSAARSRGARRVWPAAAAAPTTGHRSAVWHRGARRLRAACVPPSPPSPPRRWRRVVWRRPSRRAPRGHLPAAAPRAERVPGRGVEQRVDAVGPVCRGRLVWPAARRGGARQGVTAEPLVLPRGRHGQDDGAGVGPPPRGAQRGGRPPPVGALRLGRPRARGADQAPPPSSGGVDEHHPHFFAEAFSAHHADTPLLSDALLDAGYTAAWHALTPERSGEVAIAIGPPATGGAGGGAGAPGGGDPPSLPIPIPFQVYNASLLTKVAASFPTYTLQVHSVASVFGDARCAWNRSYRPAQQIFASGPQALMARSLIRAQHARLCGGGLVLDDGLVSSLRRAFAGLTGAAASAAEFFALTHHGVRGGKSRFFTYVLLAGDRAGGARLRFSETGASFWADVRSKHAVHSNAAAEVVYSGEFHIRTYPRGGEGGPAAAGGGAPRPPTLVMDNGSGTYAPDKARLPLLREVLRRNFPDMAVEVVDFQGPVVAAAKEAIKLHGII